MTATVAPSVHRPSDVRIPQSARVERYLSDTTPAHVDRALMNLYLHSYVESCATGDTDRARMIRRAMDRHMYPQVLVHAPM